MGVRLCGGGAGGHQNRRRPGRPHGFCGADGYRTADLRQVGLQAAFGEVHAGQQPAVCGSVFGNRAGAKPVPVAGGLRRVRLFGGYSVAGHL